MTVSPPSTRRDYTVASVARAVRLVDIVADGPRHGVTLTELTRALGLSKSGTFALARTLVDAGYVREVEPGPRYRLGLALVRLGDRAVDGYPLTEAVRPFLESLTQASAMTARAAVNDNGYPMFIARVDAPGNVRFHAPLGVRELPHSSAAGKVILAHLDPAEATRVLAETGLPRRTAHTLTDPARVRADLIAIRERGYGIDDEEDQDGVFCLSAPVLGREGAIFGALSITGIKISRTPEQVATLGAQVRDSALALTRLLRS
ncbi:IclR family transcriptional regulator [Mycetocola spongiae]|uniref:IclR family transcriptional regulator n=1 Tax=Mycetocola spongiae TaxID=2859226 RepID=UPI001CF5FB33|nr:IclR family transcriptional regulator [Mycetocola spongiae]UCR89647.1 IclR family transcriptional regulator [Mycetocola spongiae]